MGLAQSATQDLRRQISRESLGPGDDGYEEGGLMIDISPMRQRRVDPDSCRAIAAGGAQIGDLDAANAAHGLATTGGMVSNTGVGGLTMGGGYGWLAREHGLAHLGDEGADRVRAAYGEAKYARLVALKDRHDPENVLHRNQNVRPSHG